MNILALDDEKLALEGVVSSIKAALPNAVIHSFNDPEEALKDAKTFCPHIAFLDIETRGLSGLEVAEKLKEENKRINIIFVTGFEHYMKKAFDMHASGYVTKPVTEEQIKNELQNLRYDIQESPKIFMRTFGTFEVFINDKAVSFAYSKSKELLALLVDARGAFCAMGSFLYYLWDENDAINRKSYFRNLVADIRKTFRAQHCQDILIASRGSLCIDQRKIRCDYWDYLAQKDYALHSFTGEYMSQYSWAENTLGSLSYIK